MYNFFSSFVFLNLISSSGQIFLLQKGTKKAGIYSSCSVLYQLNFISVCADDN